MNVKSIEKVLNQECFTPKEKEAFLDMIKFAKACLESNSGNVKQFINNKVEEVVNNEVQ